MHFVVFGGSAFACYSSAQDKHALDWTGLSFALAGPGFGMQWRGSAVPCMELGIPTASPWEPHTQPQNNTMHAKPRFAVTRKRHPIPKRVYEVVCQVLGLIWGSHGEAMGIPSAKPNNA